MIERYLACLAVNDWDGLAATIADDDLIREGPYCDVVKGKQPYLKFLRGVFATLEGYRLDVRRISRASDRVCYVELSETFEADGVPTELKHLEHHLAGSVGRARAAYPRWSRPGAQHHR